MAIHNKSHLRFMSDYLETIGNGTTFGTVKKEQNEYLYVAFRTHYFVSKPTVFDTSKNQERTVVSMAP